MNNTTGWGVFEQTISSGFSTTTGNSLLVGLILMLFFIGYCLLQGTRLDAKIVVWIPAFFLAFAFLPQWLGIAFTIIIGWIFMAAMAKAFNR